MKAAPVLLLAAALACLALVMTEQLTSGDLYGRGSSLRTDRQGASVYFDALAKTGVRVDRNYLPLDSLTETKTLIVMLAGGVSEYEQKQFIASVSALAEAGNRVIVTLDETTKLKAWDVAVERLKKTPDYNGEDEDDATAAPWPLRFTASKNWHVVRSLNDRPIVIERNFGAGTIALVASTRPFLNLALRDHRDIELLDWVSGKTQHIVFDESHLGSRQGGTIMGLAGRLRLQGLLAVLIVAALLYFWRASIPFPPVRELPQDAGIRSHGSTSGEALRNLLERHIPPSGLMQACVQEWTRDFGRSAGPAVVQEALAAAGTASAASAGAWEKIRQIIRRAKTHD